MPEPRIDDPGFWDGLAAFGSMASRFTIPFAERALAEANPAPGADVLDIATGNGALAIAAARAGLRVLATDFSPAMVRQVLAHGLPNLDARTMNGQALDLPDAAFDAAFSNFGIMLFADWRAGLAAMDAAGFADVGIVEHANDFLIDRQMVDDPDGLFCFSPIWPILDATARQEVPAVVAGVRRRAVGSSPYPRLR